MSESGIVYSAIKTPDGTILQSRHRHDYQTYTDKNGKEYMIDGGLDYIRSSDNGDEEYITITLNHDHNIVREYTTWGTYGIYGDEPLRYITLKDMTTEHIEAVLDNVRNIHPNLRAAFLNELEYRGVYDRIDT